MQHWIGTSGYQYPEWKGSFYPEDLPARRMLSYYAERFATTEINYSFRRIPSEKTLLDWDAATPPRFKFTFKATQKITHFARLRDCESTLSYFSNTIALLNEKLGAVLFQLPPDFTKNLDRLRPFLQIMPPHIKPAFEFRHPSWFDDDTFSALRDHNAALCIAESADLKTPPIPTADFGYLRLRREDYSPAEVKEWAKFVEAQKDRWRDVYIYFKHEEAGIGPKLATQMIDALSNAE